jgi:hypothetical protein
MNNKETMKVFEAFKVATDALKEIKNEQGKVCCDFEFCHHVACASSTNSWMIAEKALIDMEEELNKK